MAPSEEHSGQNRGLGRFVPGSSRKCDARNWSVSDGVIREPTAALYSCSFLMTTFIPKAMTFAGYEIQRPVATMQTQQPPSELCKPYKLHKQMQTSRVLSRDTT